MTTLKIKGKLNKKDLPDYLEMDGIFFEKINGKTGEMPIELDKETKKLLKAKMKSGLYINEQEIVREALRELMNSIDT